MKEKILIIEDEEDLVKGLKLNLADEGYEVGWASNGEDGLRKALEGAHDLIILDIMLPKMNGLDICRELRQKNISIPIIMLTAKGEEIDKVVGLEIGADDYMTKPFSIRELLARIKAHLRREKREEKSEGKKVPKIYRFGDVEIDFAHFKVRHKGKELDLTSLEAEILKYFISHQGEVVTRGALLDKVWGYESYPTTRTIDNHMQPYSWPSGFRIPLSTRCYSRKRNSPWKQKATLKELLSCFMKSSKNIQRKENMLPNLNCISDYVTKNYV